eukprot:jgi/Mesvir1/24618/Mv21931-RA.1
MPACHEPPTFASVMKSRTGSIVPWDSLTSEMLTRSRVYPGNKYRLQKVAQKLQHGQGIRIAVAGGSVALGTPCEPKKEGELKPRVCPWTAWSSRLEEWLHAAYSSTPRDRIQVVNMARAATTSQWAATFLAGFAQQLGHPLSQFDMIIVDYENNDQHAGRDMVNTILVAAEELLVQLLELPQEPAVLYLFSGTKAFLAMKTRKPKGPKDPKFLNARPWMEDEQMRLLRHYQVPALSWRDAIWRAAFSRGRRHPLLDCHDATHPTQCLHYVWAAVVADLLRHEARAYCMRAGNALDAGMSTGKQSRNDHGGQAAGGVSGVHQSMPKFATGGHQVAPRPSHAAREMLGPAMSYQLPANRLTGGNKVPAKGLQPLTLLSVDVGRDRFHCSEMRPPGSWQFREDVPGKIGWIVEGPGSGEEISFDVLFSRRIVMAYLRSYENMGQVQVFVDNLLVPNSGNGSFSSRESEFVPAQKMGDDTTQESRLLVQRAALPAKVLDGLWKSRSSQYFQMTIVDSVVKKEPVWVRVRLGRLASSKGKGPSRGKNKFKLLAVISY